MHRRNTTALREAITLPLLFLAVSHLAALRVGAGGTIRFVGPTLLSLVLGVMLAGLLLRSGVLAPGRLVASERPALANTNGIIALLALLFASAQIFTVLTPETGLMAVLFSAFYLALLWTTAAARPAARHLLRSLMVVFGSALVLRFVVLNGLAAPGGSLAHRLFTSALEGATLGALGLEYYGEATGYAAFAALVLFFVGLLVLPHEPGAWDGVAEGSWGPSLPAPARRTALPGTDPGDHEPT